MSSLYSVSQITKYIKTMFRQDILLERVCVSGEISNCKYHNSGHIYFTLKDEGAQINCVMYRSSAAGMTFRMQNGDSVNVSGRIDVYEKSGNYQLYASKIEKNGAGKLYEKYLELKERLGDMGMFADEYKKPIPAYVRKVGIVTAPDGAAIRDIQNISRRRSPGIELFLFPALVQGEGAKESIVRGIKTMDRLGLDVLIVGRGGGSIEDLWAFNEECVAQAIFDCSTPIISAVGHETDYTIADFAADLRAPTPSAAAELAVPEVAGIFDNIDNYERRLTNSMAGLLVKEQLRLKNAEKALLHLNPGSRFSERKEKLKSLEKRLTELMKLYINNKRQILSDDAAGFNSVFASSLANSEEKKERLLDELNKSAALALKDKKQQLGLLCERLDGRSPLKKLSSGYAYVCDSSGKGLSSAASVNPGDRLGIALKDGKIEAEVIKTLKQEI